MKISAISILQRAAAFELENNTRYNAPCGFTVWLNGQNVGQFSRNVFTLTSLVPGMSYELRADFENGETANCSFITPKESCCLDVRLFGAVGDGETDCTGALQAAISACAPGGTVWVPAGIYATYPLFVKADITLYLEKDAVLLGGTNRQKYPILPGMVQNSDGTETSYGTWEGNPLDCYAALITGIHADNFAIAGEGTVDANAQNGPWWNEPKTRVGAWRPRTIFLNTCTNVTLLGITVCNSPAWTIHPYYCTNVDVVGVCIKNPPETPNTDGCNPESCQNVRILGTRISVGDDCIAVKSGKYYMSVKHLRPSKNILVRNCLLERGHGAVTVGSEVAGGVSNMRVQQCLMLDTDRGLRIKTRRGRGNTCVLTDITFENIQMVRVKAPFVANMFYYCDPDGHSDYVRSKKPLAVDELTPCVGDIVCRNVECTDCAYTGVYFYGLPEQPIQSITMENVSISFAKLIEPGMPEMLDDVNPVAGLAFFANNVKQILLSNVKFAGHQGEAVQCHNVGTLTQNP